MTLDTREWWRPTLLRRTTDATLLAVLEAARRVLRHPLARVSVVAATPERLTLEVTHDEWPANEPFGALHFLDPVYVQAPWSSMWRGELTAEPASPEAAWPSLGPGELDVGNTVFTLASTCAPPDPPAVVVARALVVDEPTGG